MRLSFLVPAVALLAASFAAHADPMDQITITGYDGWTQQDLDLSFTVPASVTTQGPYASFPTSNGMVNGVPTEIGDSIVLGNGSADENTWSLGWGAAYSPSTTLNFLRPQFQISGSYYPETLTFIPGSYKLYDYFETLGSYTMVVTQVSPAATPEPSSIVLLGSGLLGIAGVVRKRLA